METFLIPLAFWLCATFFNQNATECRDLPLPQVSFTTQTHLAYLAHGEKRSDLGIQGLYVHDKPNGHIVLDKELVTDWKQLELTLVHELYHHYQHKYILLYNNIKDICIYDLEAPAYQATIKYAKEFKIPYDPPLMLLVQMAMYCNSPYDLGERP